MAKLEINKLGSIEHCLIEDISRFTVVTGPQASGKSTIAKALFFFRTIKNDIYTFLENRVLSSNSYKLDDIDDAFYFDFIYELRNKFIRVFGAALNMDKDMFISYQYTHDVSVKVAMINDSGYLSADVCDVILSDSIKSFLKELNNCFTASAIGVPSIQKQEMMHKLNVLFDDEYETVYIPAGRSALTVLSDQLGYVYSTMKDFQKRSIDYCTQDYIERILSLRTEFSNGIEAVLNYRSMDEKQRRMIDAALKLMKRILKGKYTFSGGEERININDDHFVKINFASSGQQESVWILNLLFYYLVNNEKILFIIEEPESHLFPESQKLITEFIVLVANHGNSMLVTTHSPYVLGTLNNLLYAYDTSKIDYVRTDKVVQSECWLNPESCSAWFVSDGKAVNCMDAEIHMIKNELIDEISGEINKDFEYMLAINQK